VAPSAAHSSSRLRAACLSEMRLRQGQVRAAGCLARSPTHQGLQWLVRWAGRVCAGVTALQPGVRLWVGRPPRRSLSSCGAQRRPCGHLRTPTLPWLGGLALDLGGGRARRPSQRPTSRSRTARRQAEARLHTLRVRPWLRRRWEGMAAPALVTSCLEAIGLQRQLAARRRPAGARAAAAARAAARWQRAAPSRRRPAAVAWRTKTTLRAFKTCKEAIGVHVATGVGVRAREKPERVRAATALAPAEPLKAQLLHVLGPMPCVQVRASAHGHAAKA
jgi:hypothetical protein